MSAERAALELARRVDAMGSAWRKRRATLRELRAVAAAGRVLGAWATEALTELDAAAVRRPEALTLARALVGRALVRGTSRRQLVRRAPASFAMASLVLELCDDGPSPYQARGLELMVRELSS